LAGASEVDGEVVQGRCAEKGRGMKD
jgi:hypothetical protein